MSTLFPRRGSKRGLAPGTPVYTGPEREGSLRLISYTFDVDRVDEAEPLPEQVADLAAGAAPPGKRLWLHVVGVHDVPALQRVAEGLGLHALALEDLASTSQRPHLDEYEDVTVLFVRLPAGRRDDGVVETEQLALAVHENWVATFQESERSPFVGVRKRLLEGAGRLRKRGTDYLVYALLDAVVDEYLDSVEEHGAQLERFELTRPRRADATQRVLELHSLRRSLLFLRKAIAPLRDVVSGVRNGETVPVASENHPFLADLSDHVAHVLESVDAMRDLAGNLIDLELTLAGHRTNEIMRVLTLVSTTFIPLSFIAGLYGMNFQVMPELSLPWGYPAVLGLMAVIAAGLFWFFRRRAWI